MNLAVRTALPINVPKEKASSVFRLLRSLARSFPKEETRVQSGGDDDDDEADGGKHNEKK